MEARRYTRQGDRAHAHRRSRLEREHDLHAYQTLHEKGAIERSEPGFLCHALIPKSAVQEAETDELINKIYDGSADKLFAALLGRKKLSAEQIAQLKKIVGELE